MQLFPPHKNRQEIAFGTQKGASLIVVMLILVIVSIIGVSAVQISMMGERATRNDRDLQIAWQSAEAALVDAAFDIEGQPAASGNKRNIVFDRSGVDLAKFEPNCGTSGQTKGLCQLNAAGKPAWLAVDFASTDASAPTVAFGTFTGRNFPSGAQGIQPAQAPRYVIEAIPDPSSSRTSGATGQYVYRVTAMGFGPNVGTQAVLQMIYRN